MFVVTHYHNCSFQDSTHTHLVVHQFSSSSLAYCQDLIPVVISMDRGIFSQVS